MATKAFDSFETIKATGADGIFPFYYKMVQIYVPVSLSAGLVKSYAKHYSSYIQYKNQHNSYLNSAILFIYYNRNVRVAEDHLTGVHI